MRPAIPCPIGLDLKERSSGKHRRQLKIAKRGPAAVRFYLYFAALRPIARDPEVRRRYDRQSARAGALKGKTIVAPIAKLAKALWHVGRGATFDVKRLFAPEPLAAYGAAPETPTQGPSRPGDLTPTPCGSARRFPGADLRPNLRSSQTQSES